METLSPFQEIYSLDDTSEWCIQETKNMIQSYHMLPIIDCQTGDYYGYEIVNNICTENLCYFDHDGGTTSRINMNIFDYLIDSILEFM